MKNSIVKKVGKVEIVPKIWLSAREAKAYLDCSDEYLKKLRDNALVIFSHAENKFYYQVDSINKFLTKNRVI